MAYIMNGKFEDKSRTVKVHMAGNDLLVIEEGDDAISISPEAALWLMDWLQQHEKQLRES